jgi:hypothetical protein
MFSRCPVGVLVGRIARGEGISVWQVSVNPSLIGLGENSRFGQFLIRLVNQGEGAVWGELTLLHDRLTICRTHRKSYKPPIRYRQFDNGAVRLSRLAIRMVY